jgi:hypothetical protein
MRVSIGIATVACLVLFAGLAAVPTRRATSPAPQSTVAAGATARIVASAQAFLKTLDDAARAKVQFRFDDTAQKTRWSNLPSGIFKREGLRLGDLTPTQRAAAMALLQTALSRPGYQKVIAIMRADDVFRDSAAGNGPAGGPPAGPGGAAPRVAFGSDEFYLAFLGAPSTTDPWMLQYGGHHLAINLTLAGRRATLAPSLTGVQPATYTIERRTVRPLGEESDRAIALMARLHVAQQGKAILNYRVADLVLGPGQDGRTIQPEGVPATDLTPSQQTLLLDLVRQWVGIANDAFAAPRMDEIRANLPHTYFAWSGPTTPGSVAYFRIQGPTLVIEYAPQRTIDHIHTIYRDPTNDYGAAYARQ